MNRKTGILLTGKSSYPAVPILPPGAKRGGKSVRRDLADAASRLTVKSLSRARGSLHFGRLRPSLGVSTFGHHHHASEAT